jgi:uncharacterized protein with ParB-like and HNH nuclease domain
MSKIDGDKTMDDLSEDLPEDSSLFYSISSYGADYTVDVLIKRIKNGDIFVPKFQRNYVWNIKQASRFIESLLIGLPVPGIFLSKEPDTQKLLVIDGQQRLKTLEYFYGGNFVSDKIVFALSGVQPQFENKTYSELSDEQRRRLDDAVIHATIIKQERPESDDSSIYHIFERLNTGGTKLLPQEIRACIYHGKFNDVLSVFNDDKKWRELFGKKSIHMRDQEMILRFFALFYSRKLYKKGMIGFMNNFMKENRDLKKISEDNLTKLFYSTINTVYDNLDHTVFKPNKKFIAALFDAVMIGVAVNIYNKKLVPFGELMKKYNALFINSDFQNAITTHTSDQENVTTRISLAIKAFSA